MPSGRTHNNFRVAVPLNSAIRKILMDNHKINNHILYSLYNKHTYVIVHAKIKNVYSFFLILTLRVFVRKKRKIGLLISLHELLPIHLTSF